MKNEELKLKNPIKYQCPKLRPLNEAFTAYAVCCSGNQATQGGGPCCLAGVNAVNSTCNQGVHPQLGCYSGTLPGLECSSGAGDSEW